MRKIGFHRLAGFLFSGIELFLEVVLGLGLFRIIIDRLALITVLFGRRGELVVYRAKYVLPDGEADKGLSWFAYQPMGFLE
jgi:hypothetical protein